MSAALRALAAQTEAAEAPARVEQALRAVLRERRAAAAGLSPRPRRSWLWVTAAAAVFAGAVWIGIPELRPRAPGTAPAPAPTDSMAAGSDADEFVPLTYGAPLTELDSVQVVRVELPASALATLGWAVAGETLADTVEADVIVGPDGVARALRIVQSSADEGSVGASGGQS